MPFYSSVECTAKIYEMLTCSTIWHTLCSYYSFMFAAISHLSRTPRKENNNKRNLIYVMQFVCLLLVIVMMTDSSQKCNHKLGFELQSLHDIVNCIAAGYLHPLLSCLWAIEKIYSVMIWLSAMSLFILLLSARSCMTSHTAGLGMAVLQRRKCIRDKIER